VRTGLALGALAGVLIAVAPTGDLVSGPARGAPDTIATIDLEAVVGALGVAAAILLLAAAAAPWLWAHLVGVALAPMVGVTAGLIVAAGRSSDDLAADADVSLERGGVLLSLAFWLSMAAVIVTLIGIRRIAMAAEEVHGAGEGGRAPPRRTSGKATVSLVLAIAGFVGVFAQAFAFASSLGIAFGVLALGDIRAWRGTLGGRGVAVAGIVVGILALSLLIAVVGSAMLLVSPD
jgi:hypothetical protein